MQDPARGDYQIIGNPIKLAGNDVPIRPPPILGQHTAEVLYQLLGMNAAELDALRDEGVV